jgi:outer membrane lipoprotein carrier protein
MISTIKKLVVSALLFVASTAFATTTPMDELIALLTVLKTYQAEFSQYSYDQKGVELQHLEGEMVLHKPDNFYWESKDPFAQKLISNGRTIWHYDADLEQVVIQEYAKQAEQAPILVILRDAASLSQSYKVVDVKRKESIVTFHLAALEKNTALTAVELSFTESQLSQLGFTDNLQQKTVMMFSNIVMNEAVAAALFEFILPEGVDVLYE